MTMPINSYPDEVARGWKAELDQLRAQLAAAQAENTRLRDAVTLALDMIRLLDENKPVPLKFMRGVFQAALAAPEGRDDENT